VKLATIIIENFDDDKRIDLIRRKYGNRAGQVDFELFISHCRKYNLSPEAQQIFLVPRGNSFTTQVSLQGLRTLAFRTGIFGGTTGVEYVDKDGTWHKYWIKDYPPSGARDFANREGLVTPAHHFVKFDSFCVRNNNGQLQNQWKQKPEHMIGKCATAGAIRAAFPDYFGGITIPEEIQMETVNANASLQLPPDREALGIMIETFATVGMDIDDIEEHMQKRLSHFTQQDLHGLRIYFAQVRSDRLELIKPQETEENEDGLNPIDETPFDVDCLKKEKE